MNKGLKALQAKVLDRGQCTACGACLSLCPYLGSWKGRTVKLHDCDLSEGRCYSFCPRTEVDLNALHRFVFGKEYEDIEAGPVRRVLMARSLVPAFRERAQTGGVVSTLIDFALKEGAIIQTWSCWAPSPLLGVLPIDRKGFQMSISELLPSQRLIDNLKAFDRGAEAVERL